MHIAIEFVKSIFISDDRVFHWECMNNVCVNLENMGGTPTGIPLVFTV